MDRSNNYDQQSSNDMASYTEFFSWGSDSFGQLALANSDDEDQNRNSYGYGAPPQPQFYEDPKSLSFDIIISQISCGDYHASFISGDGFLFSFGKNSEGQLGVGDPSLMKSSAPLLVDSLPKDGENSILQVSCGGNHTAALMSSGDIYSWGHGQYGATGLNTQQNTFAPLKIKALDNLTSRFVHISCGKRHTLIVDSDGQVHATGDNSFRQLGISHTDKVLQFKVVPNFFQKASKVAAGVEHSLILTRQGEIYSAGNNQEGNLGLGHQYSSDSFLGVHGLQNLAFVTISAGRHSAAITDDNRLFVWGPVFQNESSLILPQELRSNKLIKVVSVGEKATAIIDEDQHLYTWGFSNAQGYNRRNDSQNIDDNMPQFVESLAYKLVSNVEVGLDFIIALGQDFDQNGQIIQKESNSVEQKYYPPENIISPSSNTQREQSRPNDIDFKRNDQPNQAQFIQQDDYRQDNKSNSKPPLIRNHDKPNGYDYDLQKLRDKDQTADYRNDQSLVSSHSKKSNERNQYRGPSEESSFHSSQVPFDRNNSADRFKAQPSFSNLQQPSNNHTLQHNPSGHSSTGGAFAYSSSGGNGVPQPTTNNAELYKQIDSLREENFQLKQKQRELVKSLNELKVENEQLLQNADQEIKRMSDFVDKYTQEVEQNKRKLHQEYEEKLINEKRKVDDVKQKLLKDQNEVEVKLDRLQREIETVRQENIGLQASKADAIQRAKDLQEQLNLAQQQLRQQHLQASTSQVSQKFASDRDKNFSPAGAQTPLQRQLRIEDSMQNQVAPSQSQYQQRLPVNNLQERPNLKNNREIQQTEFQDNQYNQQQKKSDYKEPPVQSYKSNSRPIYADDSTQQTKPNHREESQPIFKTLDDSNNKNGYSPFNTRHQAQNANQYVPNRYEREHLQTSANRLPINSPPRQEDEQPSNRKQSFGNLQSQNLNNYRQQQQETEERSREEYRRESYNSRGGLTSSQIDRPKYEQYQPQTTGNFNSLAKSKYSGSHQVPSAHQLQESTSPKFNQAQLQQRTEPSKAEVLPLDQLPRPQQPLRQDPPRDQSIPQQPTPHSNHLRTPSQGPEQDKNALSDVKNRLLLMQRNKEELEEKLRNYENKIKQHYNRQ